MPWSFGIGPSSLVAAKSNILSSRLGACVSDDGVSDGAGAGGSGSSTIDSMRGGGWAVASSGLFMGAVRAGARLREVAVRSVGLVRQLLTLSVCAVCMCFLRHSLEIGRRLYELQQTRRK